MAATRSAEFRKFIIDDCEIPVRIFYERRKNVRVAQGKDAVLLRIPRFCGRRERLRFQQWCDQWITGQWRTNQSFRSHFMPFEIDRVHAFRTFDRTFRVTVARDDRKSPAFKLRGGHIALQLPASWDHTARNAGAHRLIHKALVAAYRHVLTARVQALHGGAFGKPVEDVRLKLMSSKWGSCSHHGRVTLSTRLLFATEEVLDYVILHELCHLDVLNHSPAFWQRVAGIDPGYRAKETWLRQHGHTCDVKFALIDA